MNKILDGIGKLVKTKAWQVLIIMWVHIILNWICLNNLSFDLVWIDIFPLVGISITTSIAAIMHYRIFTREK